MTKTLRRRPTHVVDIRVLARDTTEEKWCIRDSPEKMLETDTLTASYLNGAREIAIPEKRRKGNGRFLKIRGATGHNPQEYRSIPPSRNVCMCHPE